jgi:hypothetical protein
MQNLCRVSLNNNSEDIGTYQQYLRKKSLSRSRFTEILQECGVTTQTIDWLSVEARLNSEKAPLPQILKLKKEWDTVRIDRLEKREDVQHVAMLAAVREATITLALRIPSNYSDCQIDMVYFRTPVARRDGRPVGALTLQPVCGEMWQQWSRHRTPQNPWRPGVDDLAAHLSLVDEWLRREFEKVAA